MPSSPPLGAGDHPRDVVTVNLRPDDVLLLVTDGLVERRGEDLDAGLDRFLAATPVLIDRVDPSALGVIASDLRQDGHDDDVTLMAVRRNTR